MTDTEVFKQDQDVNEFAAFQATRRAERQRTLGQSLSGAATVNPDQYAEATKLGLQLGKAPHAVYRAMQGVRPGQERDLDRDRLMSRSPGTAQWLSDPDRAALASDDHDGLAAIESAWKDKQGDPGLGSDLLTAYTMGGGALVKGAYWLLNQAGYHSAEETDKLMAEADEIDATLAARFSPDVQQYRQRLGEAEGFGDTASAVFSSFPGFAAQTVENLVGYGPAILAAPIGAAVATGIGAAGVAGEVAATAFAGKVGAGIASLTVGKLIEQTGYMDEALAKRGYDVRQPGRRLAALSDPTLLADAWSEAGRKGIGTAALNALSIMFAGRRLTTATGVLGKAKAGAVELVEQTAFEGAGEGVGRVAADPKSIMTPNFWKEVSLESAFSLGQSAGEITMGTVLRRAAMGGPGSQRAKEAVQEASRIIQSLADSEAISAVKEAFDASKTAQRAPERASMILEMIGAPDTLTVRAEAWDRVAKSAGKPPAQMAAETMPGGAQAYHEAMQTGSLAIPSRLAVSKLDAAQFAALVPDMEGRPGDLTPKEADASLDVLETEMEAANEQIQTLFQEGRNLEDEAKGLPDKIKAAEAEVAAEAPPETPGLFQRVADKLTGKTAAAEAAQNAAEFIAADPALVKGQRDFIKHLRETLAVDELNAQLKQASTGKSPKDYEVEGIEKLRVMLTEAEAEFAPVQDILDARGEGGKPAQRLARLKARQATIKERQAEIATESATAGQDAADVLLGKTTADLIAAGRGKAESRLLASVWVRALSTIAQRYGMSLEAMAGRFGLDIKAGEAPAQNTGELEQTAFHGGPHRFEPEEGHPLGRFQLNKIGTGEGSQVEGWGLYFASQRGVAEWYRRGLAGSKIMVGGVDVMSSLPEGVAGWISDYVAEFVDQGDIDIAIDGARSSIRYAIQRERERASPDSLADGERALALLDEWAQRDDVRIEPRGALYTVDLAPAEDEYLLWDKPLAEQSEKVRKALDSVGVSGDVALKDGLALASGGTLRVEDNADFGRRYFLESGDKRFRLTEADAKRLVGEAETGAAFYQNIATREGGAQAASKALAAAGIPGIKYLDQSSRSKGEGTYNYVLFDDKLINIVEMEQRKEGVKRGSLGIRKVGSGKLYTLTFYKEADKSTFLHEAGHALLDIMGDLASDAAAPETLRADYAATLAYLGAQPGDVLTTEQHEKWARSFEAYLREGKAPSPEVRRMFATFRSWLAKLYRDVTSLGVTLTPEVRGVMDRLLATNEEIAAAEYESGADQTLSPEDVAQLEPDAQADYWAAFHAAGDQAREQVQTALLKEIGKESRAAFEAAVSDAKPAIRAQINALPGPVALARMASGDFPKIDRAAAAEVYDAATLKALEDAGALGASGIPPDAAREALGFDSVDRMARDLVIASQREGLVEAAARAKVASEAGRFMSPADLKAESRKATRSAQYAAKIRAELAVMNTLANASEEARRAAFRAVPSIQNLRAYAEGKVEQTAYRDIKPGQWLSGAKREARASKAAMQAGKYLDAAEAKARELLNFEMHRISANVKEAMATDARVIGRMQSEGRQSTVGKAGGQYRNHLNKLSARFGFSSQRPDEAAETGPLAGWIAQLQKQADEENGSALVPSVAAWITDSEAPRDWRTLTPAELRDVRDAIEQVYTLGRDIHRAYAGNQAETLMERAAKVRAAIRASGKPLDRPFQAKPTGAQRYIAEHSPIDRYVAEIDGEAGGPLFDAFLRLRNEAEDSKSVRRRAANKSINAAFKHYGLAEKATFGLARQIPGTDLSLSREHVQMIALYEGSASGRALNRNTFTDERIAKILATLTKADAAWLNAMWEHEDSYWPEFKALVEKVWGVAPPKIEAVPFRVLNAQGETLELRGGYTRVKYEGVRAHELSIADTANEIKQAAVIRSQPKASSRHSREKGVQQELRYDFGVVMEHIGEQIQALSVLESVHDMNFVLREVRDDLIDVRGREVYDEFTKAFKELAVGKLGAQSAAEQLASHFRAGVVISKLGFKVGTNLINMTGIAASIDHLGPAVIGEMASLNMNPVEFSRAVKEMWAESRFMDTRAETFNRETNDIRNQLNKRFDMSSLEAIPMSMLALTQLWVDAPTWRVAKRQALAAGHDHAKAIAIADQAVKDTQGSGLPADMPSVMREHKFFTVFMGYVNRQMNRTASRVRATEWTNPSSVGRTALSLGLTWMLPAAASVFMYGALRGDDDEDPFWLSTLEETLLSMAGSGVLVRELASAYRFEKNYSGPAATALFDVFGETVGSLKDGKLTQRDFETTLSLAGIALHLPTAQALETYKGFKAYLAGRAGPQAVLLGPPRDRR